MPEIDLDTAQTLEGELESIETSCKQCVFANYEQNTQVGCYLNRIDVFQSNGVIVDECRDDEKEFYVIRNKLCNTCRQSNWLQKDESIEKAIIRIKDEISTKSKPDIYVYLDGTISSMVPLLDTLDSLSKQEVAPANVIILNNSRGKIKSSVIMNVLRTTKLRWSVDHISDINDSRGRAIDLAVRKSKGMAYVCLDVGSVLPPDYLKQIDIALNQNLQQFIMLEDDHYVYISTFAHKLLNGNASTPINEKIKRLAEHTDKDFLIQSYKAICLKNNNPNFR